MLSAAHYSRFRHERERRHRPCRIGRIDQHGMAVPAGGRDPFAQEFRRDARRFLPAAARSPRCRLDLGVGQPHQQRKIAGADASGRRVPNRR